MARSYFADRNEIEQAARHKHNNRTHNNRTHTAMQSLSSRLTVASRADYGPRGTDVAAASQTKLLYIVLFIL